MGMIVNEAWSFEQTLNHISTVRSLWNLVEIGYVVAEELFNNIMILYI